VGALLAVPPQSAFHCVDIGDGDRVAGITTLQEMPLWENGGYFVFRPEIFDYLPPNGDLIMDACRPLAAEGRLLAHRHRGFWQPADTVKERHGLEAAYRAGERPWMLWERNADNASGTPAGGEPDLVAPDPDPLQAAIAAMRGSLVER
jgi:glucose-1-phosphate cytidylyltransferase